jgi:hypothetical protein
MSGQAAGDILEAYPPPYTIVSDMLFAVALCPAPKLQQAFPQTPFLSLAGRIPLLLWFSLFHEIRYHAPGGEVGVLGGPEAALYNELNIMALLKRRAFFIPAIYATTDLSLRLGKAYGMPKKPIAMHFTASKKQINSEAREGERLSFVQAHIGGTGRVLAKLANLFWTWWTWPARLPGGGSVRAQIQSTPRIYPAFVRRGQLWVEEEWMPHPLVLLPLGLYAPNLRMQLPPP